jgi:DNA-binding MarR family transcriptional regulator
MSQPRRRRARGRNLAAVPQVDRAVTVVFAHRILGLRRLREEMLGADLFSDPAWDLLLHLYVQTATGRQVAISSLCRSARVRPTTGLRWINLLVDAGLLVKANDPADARRVFVAFARGGADSMHALLARAMTEAGSDRLDKDASRAPSG